MHFAFARGDIIAWYYDSNSMGNVALKSMRDK